MFTSLRGWRYCLGARLKLWRRSRDPKKGVGTRRLNFYFSRLTPLVTASPPNLTRLLHNSDRQLRRLCVYVPIKRCIRKFHVVVVQGGQGKVPKQCDARKNLLPIKAFLYTVLDEFLTSWKFARAGLLLINGTTLTERKFRCQPFKNVNAQSEFKF